MADGTVHAFVCGHPIAHSRSPRIHNYWLKTSGIAGSYRAIDIAPADFPDFMKTLQANGLAGGNITIPHKEMAFDLVSRRDEAATLIGAVNTVWIENGVLSGANTDAHGFSANLDDYAPQWRNARAAVVLGAGGAARAVIHALQNAGISDIRIVNRTLARATELVDRFGRGVSAHQSRSLDELLADTDLLINTTALGMAGNQGLPADPAGLPAHAIVHDIVYVPLQTPLLAAAARHGLQTVDGLGMLLHQAAPAFERWFGRLPQVTPELRALVVADLESGH